MDVSFILNDLNAPQREAVAAAPGNFLILAGAGSGKTRVLVHRIAWLIAAEGMSPFSILAVTFTNKAAAEMRGRLEQLLGYNAQGMWVGTFHSIAHRLLRAHWRDAGLIENFQIMDSDDTYRMVRRVMKSLNIDEDNIPPKQAQWYIDAKKEQGLRPQHIQVMHNDYQGNMLLKIYSAYEEACEFAGLVDFSELLLRAHELWLQKPEILEHYQNRFRTILVDEFQDTNTIQYAWIRILVGKESNIVAVGDDDQSIYGWRGAKIENIHRISQDFPDTQTIRLEQNYRSTGNILAAANALISCNSSRLGKKLWTSENAGEPISVYAAFNEKDEASFVVERIKAYLEEGGSRSDVAILYRSNAQSRVLEEGLLYENIPYRVYGGQRFFERAEIKDALGYLRLLHNKNDTAAFERIVNMPTRGIGQKTLNDVRDYARDQGKSLWQAACEMIANDKLTARAQAALANFMHLIDDIQEYCADKTLDEQIQFVLEASGLFEHYQKEKSEKSRAKVENLQELVSAARQFEPKEEDLPVLADFLSHAALEAGDMQADEFTECVQMMTLHAAKGLEFSVVFICGMEEKLFPHKMCIDDPAKIEEERRLCYVGITRARKKLYCCYAQKRSLYGQDEFHKASRFLRELPKELLAEVRMTSKIQRPISSNIFRDTATTNEEGLGVGQRVVHQKFGEGVVLDCEGSGQHARVQVAFSEHGTKWLVLSFANLEVA